MGQLGLGDTNPRLGPTLVEGLSKETIVHAATGKAHTVFMTVSGAIFACGCNKFGAVGSTPPKKHESALKPVSVPGVSKAVRVACGADFSMVLTESGSVYSFGWSEYGQLGHGTDGSYNKAESSIKITYEAERTPAIVAGLSNIVQISCGPHHACALQADGTAYTWGCGGYGRLGHESQDDVWAPKALPNYLFRKIACGNAWCLGVGWRVYAGQANKPSGAGMLHKWGRQMPNKDSDMYPKPEYDLQGWDIDVMECGNTHTFISAGGGEEQSAIAYGSGTGHGELGFGDGDAKSSAKPKKVDSLEGVKVAAVGCGQAHTVVLVDGSDEYVTALPAFTPVADLDFSESSSNNSSSSGSGGKGKKKAGSQGGSGGKKAKKK
jgi:alpha-tubulin suppressor-like RCC1 family protein